MSAPPVLHRRDGRAAVALSVGVTGGLPTQERSSGRAALLHCLAIQQPGVEHR